MIPNPIREVLSSVRAHRVHALLMGGQACVFYGAAEFSRDTDLAIVADAAHLARLRRALETLQAEVIAVRPSGIGKGPMSSYRRATGRGLPALPAARTDALLQG